ncbi:MAG: type II secretion system protein N [Oceanospirillaceae bacterium]|nr:type II secretion system protein N [Oceanospirillaceae bacterium]
MGLITNLPVTVISYEVQKIRPDIIIGKATGPWWDAQLDNVSWQQIRQASVSWDLDFTALIKGQVVAQFDFSQASIKGSTALSLPLRQLLNPKNIQLTGTQAQVDIEKITPYAPYPLPKTVGKITIFADQLSLNLAPLKTISSTIPMIALETPISFSTSDIVVLDQLSMGTYSGAVTNTNNPMGYKITLESESGDLNIKGYSLLTNNAIKSQYLVKPSATVNPQLTKLLDIMGQRLQNGDYSFNTAYSL